MNVKKHHSNVVLDPVISTQQEFNINKNLQAMNLLNNNWHVSFFIPVDSLYLVSEKKLLFVAMNSCFESSSCQWGKIDCNCSRSFRFQVTHFGERRRPVFYMRLWVVLVC